MVKRATLLTQQRLLKAKLTVGINLLSFNQTAAKKRRKTREAAGLFLDTKRLLGELNVA